MLNGNPQGAMAGTMPLIGWFRYFPNGSTNPVVASCEGPLARFISSITYSATGIQTIVFTSDFGFAGDKAFVVDATSDTLGHAFDASALGAYDVTTRTLVIQQRGTTSGIEVAAAAGSFVNVFVYGDRSSV